MSNRHSTKKYQCPICGGITGVVNSYGDGESIRRRRECQDCKSRFSTIEIDIDLYRKITAPSNPKKKKKSKKQANSSSTER